MGWMDGMDALRGGDWRYLQPTRVVQGTRPPARVCACTVSCARLRKARAISNLGQSRDSFEVGQISVSRCGASPRACSSRRRFSFEVEVSAMHCMAPVLLAAAHGRPASLSAPAVTAPHVRHRGVDPLSSGGMDRSDRQVQARQAERRTAKI